MRAMEQDLALLCPGCGYDVRGTASEACAECGAELDRAALAWTQIPWVQPERGALSGFVATAWWVTQYPKRAAQEVGRPIEFAPAQRFRQIMVLWLTLPAVGAVLLAWWAGAWESWPGWLAGVTAVGIVLGTWLAMQAITGVPTYFLHPRHLSVERQNRAVALGHYACGPMVFLPVLLGLLTGISPFVEFSEIAGPIAIIVLAGLTLVSILGFWRVCRVLMSRTANRSASAVALIASLLPIIWGVLLLAGILGVPLLAGYVALIVQSF